MKLVSKVILLIIIATILINGCSKEDNPFIPQDEGSYLWIHFGTDSSKVHFKDLVSFDVDGLDAIKLNNFVSTELIPAFEDKDGNLYESRKLYSYQLVGDDGFSASVKGYPNNTWDQLAAGHIIVDTRQIVFPDDILDLAGAYNVKDASHLYIHRKFDIVTADTTAFIEIRTIDDQRIHNHNNILENAIPLKECIADYVTDYENHTYNIKAIDGFGPSEDLTWNYYNKGFWLLESEETIFNDATLVGGRYKIKALEKILVN